MLADRTRVRLVWTLAEQEVSVNGLAEAVVKPAAGLVSALAKCGFSRTESSHVGQLVDEATHNAKPPTRPLPEDYVGGARAKVTRSRERHSPPYPARLLRTLARP
jgi:hypothetical protein